MTEQEGGAKELFHTIVSHPALLITVLLGGGLVVFLLVRNSPQNTTTTSGSAASYGVDSPGLQTLLNYGYTVSPPVASSVPSGNPTPVPSPQLPNPTPVPNPVSVPTPTPIPANPYPLAASTRSVWPGTQPNDVPIFNAAYVQFGEPNGAFQNSVGGIPLNTQVSVGNAVQGSYAGKVATYYPVTYNGTTGYIASWDLSGVPSK